MACAAWCCFVLVILAGAGVQVEGLWNFRAVGEYLTVDVVDCNKPFKVDATRYFKELYYSDGKSINKTALRIDAKEEDASAFFGDLKQGTVFAQIANDDCRQVTKDDPDLPKFNPSSFESEAVYAPIFVTLSELRYRVMNDSDGSLEVVNERGLSAVKARLDLKQKSDPNYYVEDAYLTFEQEEDGSYDYENLIPLSIQLCVVNNGSRTIERLSIVEFAWNTTVEEETSPPTGIRCDGYGNSALPDVFNVSTLVLRTEQVLDGNVTEADIALDFDRKLLRVDNGVNDYFLSTSQKLIYKVANPDSRVQSCDLLPLGKTPKLNWTFVDFVAKSAEDFFGVNKDFRIKTKTKRRGIECDLVSGIRDDYMPEKGAALWEWCIGEMQTATGVQKYLVHLDISIRLADSSYYRESYSLYDVENIEQKKLYLDYFTELEPCFDILRKLNLQVIVDGPKAYASSDDDIETVIESGYFKAAILDRILQESKLSADSYRFGSTEAYILESRDAVFQFYLLDAPKGASEDERVDNVYKRLQKTVSEPLSVDVNGIKFSIRKDSMTEAHEMNRRSTTTSPTTQTDPSTNTTPEHSSSSSSETQTEPSSAASPEHSSPSSLETQTEPSPATTPEKTTPPSPETQTESSEPTTPEDLPSSSTAESDASTTERDNGNDLPEVAVGSPSALVWGVGFAALLVGGGVGFVAGNKLLVK